MKGIIQGTSRVSLSGSVTTSVSTYHADAMIHARLRRLYPEANQRVFAGIVTSLADKSAQRLQDKEFRAAVTKELLGVAQIAYPESNYNERSSYSALYTAVDNFIKSRDDKLGRNPIRR